VPERDALGLEIWSFLQGGSPYEIVERDDGMISAAESVRYYFSEFAHWNRRQKLAMRYVKGRRALDVGCGAGRVVLYLQRKRIHVVATEPRQQSMPPPVPCHCPIKRGRDGRHSLRRCHSTLIGTGLALALCDGWSRQPPLRVRLKVDSARLICRRDAGPKRHRRPRPQGTSGGGFMASARAYPDTG
jgi:hypothetical protein